MAIDATPFELLKGHLKFPATQNPSTNPNTLDDYEEGTFTPSITFQTPGDQSITYSIQYGQYTKVGNTVSFRLGLRTATFTHSTASGRLRIIGLPFSSGLLPDSFHACTIGLCTGLADPLGDPISPGALVSGSEIALYTIRSLGTGPTQTSTADATHVSGAQFYVYISGVYFV